MALECFDFIGIPKGFFIGKNMTFNETQSNIESARQSLVLSWLKSVDQVCVVPTVNLSMAANLITQAQSSGATLAFVAIGCADWVDWSNESEKIWHIGKIDAKNKRALRFADEIKSFQQALSSFQVNSVINFSLSNVEIHDSRTQTLGGKFDDQTQAQENINISNQLLTEIFSQSGINFNPFNHWELVNQLGFDSTRQFTTYFDFINSLYAFDLAHTAPGLIQPGQIGPIWLDIQSFSFPELVTALRNEAKICMPDLPILSPFKNAGNWHAKPETANRFPDIFELMQHNFNFKSATSIEEWQEKALKLPDEVILAALNALGFIDIQINDDWNNRKQAIKLLAQIAFVG